MVRRLLPVNLLLIMLGLAACDVVRAAVPFSSPTPPPIPTDIPVEFTTPAAPAAAASLGAVDRDATPSPTPFVPTALQLTEAGCCDQPFWSPDGRQVLFIDQPAPTSPMGIYGVSIKGGGLHLVNEQIGLPSPDGRYLAFLSDEGETLVQDVAGEAQWVIPNDGRRVFFSPGSVRLAWADVARSDDFDHRKIVVSVSNIDGGDPHEVITLFGDGIAGWLDDDHLLLVGRDRKSSQDIALFSLSLTDGARIDLIRNQQVYSAQVAPGGEWIVYTITSSPTSTESGGLWVINADGSQRYKLDVVGEARWRDGSHLLVIPLEPDAPSNRLWQFDVHTGAVEPLTDPARLAFRVLGDDWSVSPTGEHLVFRNAEDQALWLLTLPPVEVAGGG
jgi:Tol biopolymer transport system component